MKIHPALGAFLVGPIACWLHTRAWEASLPERVATHFRGDGVPNGWMSRHDALTFDLSLMVGLNLLLLVITVLLGALPASMINLPNREHWLAPERRDETMARMTVRMAVFVVGLSAFLISVFQITFEASLQIPPGVAASTFPVYLGVFFAFVAVWVGWLVMSFRLPGPA